jgi:outer membrane cobalamin receptor
VQNALQAVQRLRPNFLQTHGGMSSSMTLGPQDVVVYVDNTRMGGPSALSQIPITEVKEIQYLNGPDATQRFGTGHGSGAIIVTRR